MLSYLAKELYQNFLRRNNRSALTCHFASLKAGQRDWLQACVDRRLAGGRRQALRNAQHHGARRLRASGPLRRLQGASRAAKAQHHVSRPGQEDQCGGEGGLPPRCPCALPQKKAWTDDEVCEEVAQREIAEATADARAAGATSRASATSTTSVSGQTTPEHLRGRVHTCKMFAPAARLKKYRAFGPPASVSYLA